MKAGGKIFFFFFLNLTCFLTMLCLFDHPSLITNLFIVRDNYHSNTNELATTFVSTAHNSFLSENAKSKATTRPEITNEMATKQISFFLGTY